MTATNGICRCGRQMIEESGGEKDEIVYFCPYCDGPGPWEAE